MDLLPVTPAAQKLILIIEDYDALKEIYLAWTASTCPNHQTVFTKTVKGAEEVLKKHRDEICLVISDGILSGSFEWRQAQVGLKEGHQTAADVMHLMKSHGVTTPFVLVSGATEIVLPMLPRAPDATFSKGTSMKEIFTAVKRLIG